jgi:hypothetical protein
MTCGNNNSSIDEKIKATMDWESLMAWDLLPPYRRRQGDSGSRSTVGPSPIEEKLRRPPDVVDQDQPAVRTNQPNPIRETHE